LKDAGDDVALVVVPQLLPSPKVSGLLQQLVLLRDRQDDY